ncbi:TfoX/Sxy family protein [Mucilaginibacter sp.]|uniref:TfoX/Sxy family protein n=1 Tax=Mucilaginibacter sp. TaxID=1882438 RepID=UPI0035BC5D76
MVNEDLINRVREALMHLPQVEEKKMFGGICFLVDDKLCICVNKHEMLCRINPAELEVMLELDGVRPMMQRDRTAKGYVFIHEDVLIHKTDFNYWIAKALAYNKTAKASKRK